MKKEGEKEREGGVINGVMLFADFRLCDALLRASRLDRLDRWSGLVSRWSRLVSR